MTKEEGEGRGRKRRGRVHLVGGKQTREKEGKKMLLSGKYFPSPNAISSKQCSPLLVYI